MLGGNGRGQGTTDVPSSAVLSKPSVTVTRSAPVDPWGAAPPGYVPGRGRGATGFAGGVSRDDSAAADTDRGDYSDRNFDEFTGYNESLFKDAEYDEEDRQADILYESIEIMMDMRRRSRREKRLKEQVEKLRAEKPTIQQQFADLKGDLSSVTAEEWGALPDIGDTTLRTKQKRPQRFMPVPHSVAKTTGLGGQNQLMQTSGINTPMAGGMVTPLIAGGLQTPLGLGLSTPLGLASANGMSTPMGLATPMGHATPLGLSTPLGLKTPAEGDAGSVMRNLGEARGAVLGVKLDSVVDHPLGQTNIDPAGYLTALDSLHGAAANLDVLNLAKTRALMKSVVATNPTNASGWIAYARLEEKAGRINRARDIMADGCAKCPKNEEVWLEAARLAKPEDAEKWLIAATKKYLPQSVRLWLERASLHEDPVQKRRICRQALEQVSNSVRLWNEAVGLENETNAKILLARAVECVPQAVDLWLKLAKLSDFKNAMRVLNEARRRCPTSTMVWIAAAQLEESRGAGNPEQLQRIIASGIKKLRENEVVFDRATWLAHAKDSEAEGCPKTTVAIIQAVEEVVGSETADERSLKQSRLEEASKCLEEGRVGTARACLQALLRRLPKKKAVWLAVINLEKKHGTKAEVERLLQLATETVPLKDVFWLMLAKERWLAHDVQRTRDVLERAQAALPKSEKVILAAVKIEQQLNEVEKARSILKQARQDHGSALIWMHSVQLERRFHYFDKAKSLCKEGLELHPRFAKLWLIAAHLEIESEAGPTGRSRAAQLYEKATTTVPGSVPVWCCAIQNQLDLNLFAKARALRERAQLLIKDHELIWLKAVEIELADPTSPNEAARQMMARAVQRCPKSGILWAESVWLEDVSARGAKVVEGLKATDNHPTCVLAAARIFWAERKEKKARDWFTKAQEMAPRDGDILGARLAFEIQHGRKRDQLSVIARAEELEPNEGLKWNRVAQRLENWSKTIAQKLLQFVEEYHPDVLQTCTLHEDVVKKLNAPPVVIPQRKRGMEGEDEKMERVVKKSKIDVKDEDAMTSE